MFEVHCLLGLSQTKLRMEYTPVQTEPRSIIKPAGNMLECYHQQSSWRRGRRKKPLQLICVKTRGCSQGAMEVRSGWDRKRKIKVISPGEGSRENLPKGLLEDLRMTPRIQRLWAIDNFFFPS